jgi:hypothetical protein
MRVLRLRPAGRAAAALSAAFVLAAPITAAPAWAQGGMVFATQEAGTMFFTVGSGMAKVLGEKTGRRVAVQPYTGSSVYLPLVDNGEATLALSSGLDADAAFRGRDRAALKNLRMVARVLPLRVGLMVRAESGIKSVADLKGKRVTLDLRGQRAMGQVIRAMLAAGGLKEGDIRPITVANVGEGAKGLTEGNLDAAFTALGIPIVKQAHSTISGGVAYVDLGAAEAATRTMGGMVPGVYAARVEPNPALPEVKAPITTAAFDVFLLTSAKTSDADVAQILKTLWDNWADLQKDYPPLRGADAKLFGAPTNTVPYHPAATAFFKAQNLWTAANDEMEKKVAP